MNKALLFIAIFVLTSMLLQTRRIDWRSLDWWLVFGLMVAAVATEKLT